ncbi:unnamed protein product [Arctia plantaginis]|uniref:Uncharacterized protein n=1 Tax=Arctia plantaginis TaxID=874455 RepID=A0A8S1BIB0_ARCPL|nr:unnamed protein product [Arctia plantaginis]CAB3262504.1 unnamed protein product [Arctia plantaginis]
MGEELLVEISEERQEKWISTINSIDLTHSTKKAWSTIHKLTNEPPKAVQMGRVTVVRSRKPSRTSTTYERKAVTTTKKNTLTDLTDLK